MWKQGYITIDGHTFRWEHRPDTPQAQAAVKQLIEKYN
jgi:hypothetical protein